VQPQQHGRASPAAFSSLPASLNMFLNPIPATSVFLFHAYVIAAMGALLQLLSN
jgi:hypothetical protein